MKITHGAVLSLPAEEAFTLMSDPLNWPRFSSGVRAVDEHDDWDHVGGATPTSPASSSAGP